jgi:cytoskeletal protein RodZ
MADNQENQATQRDELQPPDHEPQLERPEAEPQVEAGGPKRWKKRNPSRPQKIDSSTWITAAISAVAALAGALLGAFAFYHTAQSPAYTQAGTAKSSATAKGNADRINKRDRQKDYADYLKNERSLVNTEASLVSILRGNPVDFGALNSAKDKWNKDSVTAARTDLILSFNDSDNAENIREKISHQTEAIHKALAKLVDQAYANAPIDQPGLQDLDIMFAALESQFDRFTDQAKADLRSPNGGLPTINGCS